MASNPRTCACRDCRGRKVVGQGDDAIDCPTCLATGVDPDITLDDLEETYGDPYDYIDDFPNHCVCCGDGIYRGNVCHACMSDDSAMDDSPICGGFRRE